jgi:single-strand DNA-binding protein
MNYNQAIIAGRLTRDPELKALPSGAEICNFSLATSSAYTDKDGNRQEATEYHNVVVYGKNAANCAKYLTKGQIALVEGRLVTRSWDKDGVKHYRTEINANRVEFGPRVGEPKIVEDSQVEYPEDEAQEQPF